MSSPKFINVLEPRINFPDSMVDGVYAAVQGGVTLNYREYSSASIDNSSCSFNVGAPSLTDVLHRAVVLQVPVSIEFIGPGDGSDNAMLQSGRDAFRSFPLEHVIKTMLVTINGLPITCNMSDIVDPLSRYHFSEEFLNNGITPNFNDNCQNYADLDGSVRNPLSWYSDNSSFNPRGAYTNYSITENTNTRAVISGVLNTFIMLSPFEWLSFANASVVPGLTKIDTLDFQFTFASNLSRMWSRSTANTVPVSVVNVTMGSLTPGGSGASASLKILWITPPDQVKQRIRNIPKLTYPYFTTNRYDVSSGTGNIVPNATTRIVSQTINFKSVPNAMYIYVTQDESTIVGNLQENLTAPSSFFGIENIEINIANVNGVLSSAKPSDLYNIAVRNGLKNTTYSEFVGTTNAFNQLVSTFVPNQKIGLTGTCLRLEPGVDFSLPEGLAAGVTDKVDLQITVTCRNINQSKSLTPQLHVLLIYEGYLVLSDSRAYYEIGPLRPSDLRNANYSEISWNDLMNNYGGGLTDKFNLLSKKIGPKLRKINNKLKDTKAISKGLKYASYAPTRFSNTFDKASQIAEDFGYGECNCDYGGVLVEEQRGLVGGRMIDSKALKSALKKRR